MQEFEVDGEYKMINGNENWQKIVEKSRKLVEKRYPELFNSLDFGAYIYPINYFVSFIFYTNKELEEAKNHQKDIRDQVAEELVKLKEEKELTIYQMEADKVKELLGEGGKKSVMEDLAINKAVEFVVENAKETKAKAKKAEADAE